jgi:hypothetical protein
MTKDERPMPKTFVLRLLDSFSSNVWNLPIWPNVRLVRPSYLRGCLSPRLVQEKVMSTMQEWLADPTCSSNTTLLLMASILYSNEGNDVEALKCCHSASSPELYVTKPFSTTYKRKTKRCALLLVTRQQNIRAV